LTCKNGDLQTAGGSSGGSSSTENYFTITSNFSHRNNHFENNTGQSPPELVRDTMLRQDAQFREQVGGLSVSTPAGCIHHIFPNSISSGERERD
jgi:hypothetical protein